MDDKKGWKTDPVCFLFNEVCRRMATISGAFVGDPAEDHSQIEGVNANPLFSRDHFQYMLCHVFSEARKGWQVDDRDRPIIWRTKRDDRGCYTGQCMLFHFQPNRIYPALPEDVGRIAAVASVMRQNGSNSFYDDNFFQTVHGQSKGCPSIFVIIGRMYLHLVCNSLNAGHGADQVKLGNLETFASQYTIGDRMFCHFWQTDRNMHDYIVRTAKELDLWQCVGLLQVKENAPKRYTNSWTAITTGVDVDLLKQRLSVTQAAGNPVPSDSETLMFNVICSTDTPGAASFDSNLRQESLGRAIGLQQETLVITDLFLTYLMDFRKSWTERRNEIQTAKESAALPDVDLDLLNQLKNHVITNGFRMIGLKRNKLFVVPTAVVRT